MKQILQNLSNGRTEVAEVPCPQNKPGHLLIHTTRSLISSGTERMLLEFGKAGWIEKARRQPDKVRLVLDKVRTDGLMPTVDAVLRKLDKPLPLGYCSVGRVGEIGSGAVGFEVGDRVVSNGPHAEIVSVPVNLCATVPDAVGDEEAAFAVVGAIALQGIRLARPTLGETVVVTGLGLIGLLTVQLLQAHGCRVVGVDFDKDKVALARQFGAAGVDLSGGADPVAEAHRHSRGRGVDAVLITASTQSSEPVRQAARMCRRRGRIVLVGVTGLELSRADFYEKELTFQVSCSYGPGRYDPNYEQKGQDYPIGFVRWTVQRNLEAVLDMMADGRIDLKPLISHRFSVSQAVKAYELVGGSEPSLGVLLTYPDAETAAAPRTVAFTPHSQAPARSRAETKAVVSFIGAGNYADGVLIPAFKKAGAQLHSVASVSGVSGLHVGRKFGFRETATDTERLFSEPASEAVVIATRHDSHAPLVLQALAAGKHVFVEKPLCLTQDELHRIEEKLTSLEENQTDRPMIMVGFNRRFSPLVQKINSLLAGVSGPKALVMTVNAGALPAGSWPLDREVGGGRVIGEACHFIDLLRFLVGAPVAAWHKAAMEGETRDTLSIHLDFSDGSVGTIHYFANGNKSFPKERLEIFTAGRVLQLNNFRTLRGFGWPGFKKMRLWRQDKGQNACAAAFVRAVEKRGESPIPLDEVMEVSRIAIEVAQ